MIRRKSGCSGDVVVALAMLVAGLANFHAAMPVTMFAMDTAVSIMPMYVAAVAGLPIMRAAATVVPAPAVSILSMRWVGMVVTLPAVPPFGVASIMSLQMATMAAAASIIHSM